MTDDLVPPDRERSMQQPLNPEVRPASAGRWMLVAFVILVVGLAAVTGSYFSARQARAAEKAARQLELESRARAELEASRTRESLEFISDLLKSADPSQGMERTLSVRQVIEGAARELEASLDQGAARALWESAGRRIEENLESIEAAHSKDSPRYAAALLQLAEVHMHQGRAEDCLSLCSAALQTLEKAEAGDEDRARAHERTGDALLSLNRADEADLAFSTARSLYTHVLGDDHPKTMNVLCAQARVAHKRGDHRGALELLEEALPILDRAFAGREESSFNNHRLMAECLFDTGDARRALEQWELLWKEVEGSPGWIRLQDRDALIDGALKACRTLDDPARLEAWERRNRLHPR